MRVGLGFDVHRFDPGPARRPLILGGVEVPSERSLSGHSDADVIAHAVADALLGAAGLGDIGDHFPDSDPAYAGADSLELLARVAAVVRERGWSIANADCTVILERPKIAPVRADMERRLSEAVGAPVSVKATRPETLGALGREEGIACHAVALIIRA